jgi:hypothetical protein
LLSVCVGLGITAVSVVGVSVVEIVGGEVVFSVLNGVVVICILAIAVSSSGDGVPAALLFIKVVFCSSNN